MATTLLEAAKYTVNQVKRGVLMEIVKDSLVMSKLAFIDVVGNAYQYTKELTLPTAEFHAPNDIWTESTGQVAQKTAVITILGGDADLDNFIKQTRSDKTDIEAETIQQKSKAVKHTFLDKFWYGQAAVANQYDGVHQILLGADMINPVFATPQVIHEGTGAAPGSLKAADLDAAIDLILDGKPDCILVNRPIRRRMFQYLRSKNNVFMDRDEFGNPLRMWNEVPVEYDDFIVQTESVAGGVYSSKTGGTASTAFLLRFGVLDLLGLQNGGLEVINIGQLEAKDAMRHRIRWYVSLALMRVISMAAIDGIANIPMQD